MQTIDDVIAEGMASATSQPLSRRQVIPYDDLKTLNTPGELNPLTNALIPTLSIGVAQGKDKPRLLVADAQGRLVVSAGINPLAKFADNFTGGGTLVTVDDTSGFFPGQNVSFVSQISGGPSCGGMTVLSVVDSTHLRVFSSCGGQNFVPGDFVVAKGSVSIDPSNTTFSVKGSGNSSDPPVNTQLTGPLAAVAPGAPLPGDTNIGGTNTIYGHRRQMIDGERSYDSQGRAAFTSGVRGNLTFFALGVGFRYCLHTGAAWWFNGSAAGIGVLLQVWQDAVTTGTLLWEDGVWIPAGQLGSKSFTGARWKGNDNKQMILSIDNGIANVNGAVSGGAFIEG